MKVIPIDLQTTCNLFADKSFSNALFLCGAQSASTKLLLISPTVIEDLVLAGQGKSFAGASEIYYDYVEYNPV
jgi:hypothetical protein